MRQISNKIYGRILDATDYGVAYLIIKGANIVSAAYLVLHNHRMNKKRSEAFFEKGRLYQIIPNNPDLPTYLALYSLEDIEFAIEEADRSDFTPFLLKKSLQSLNNGDIFMLIEIRRYRFDYCILKALVGDQIFGIILYNKMAMYPWEVFTDISG